MGPNGNPLRNEQLTADAVRQVGAMREVPRGFYERPDGIVAPERLKNPDPQITINGKVDQEMFRNVSSTLQRVSETSGVLSTLRVNFSSFGGEVTSGFGVHDLLTVFGREHNVPVSITGYGPIMSMGALILQAGDIRRMPKNSRMLLHPVSTHISGDVGRVEHQVEESRALYTMYTQIVAERVQKAGKSMTPEEVKALMEANAGVGSYLTSEKALELGLIDEII